MEVIEAFLFLSCIVFVGTKCEVTYSYVPKFTDKVYNCENFDNKILDCSGLALSSEKGDDGCSVGKLGGKIITLQEIPSDIYIDVDIWKLEDIGKELMYNIRVPFCDSLQDESSPWYEIMQMMNITGCPVPKQTFEVNGISISLDGMKDVLRHEHCGDYSVGLYFVDLIEKISCHTISLSLAEIEENNS